jgi:hypothetical protein
MLSFTGKRALVAQTPFSLTWTFSTIAAIVQAVAEEDKYFANGSYSGHRALLPLLRPLIVLAQYHTQAESVRDENKSE